MKNYFPMIKFRTYINCPPAKVFKAISTGDGWDGWFTNGTEINFDKKKIFFRWKDLGPDKFTGEEEASLIEMKPNELFSFSWHGNTFQHPTLVSLRLEKKGDGTIITVTDEGYPKNDKGEVMYMDCSAGWAEAMTLLKVYLEEGYRYQNWEEDISHETQEQNYPM